MKKSAKKKRESFFVKTVEESNPVVIIEEKAEAVVQNVEEVVMSTKKRFFKKRPFQIAFFAVLVLVIGGFFAFLQYKKVSDERSLVGNSSEVSNLIAEVGDKMILPKETPTIATVTDVTKLSNQPFFKSAVNGDKVMIFGTAKEVILYRPSIHKIVEVAPINTTAESASPAAQTVAGAQSSKATSTPTKTFEKIKIIVLNSTKTAGLAKKASGLLDASKVDIISTGNAVGEYDTTTVSLLPGSKVTPTELKPLLTSLGITPGFKSLPAGEVTPTGADAVIILGSDYASQK